MVRQGKKYLELNDCIVDLTKPEQKLLTYLKLGNLENLGSVKYMITLSVNVWVGILVEVTPNGKHFVVKFNFDNVVMHKDGDFDFRSYSNLSSLIQSFPHSIDKDVSCFRDFYDEYKGYKLRRLDSGEPHSLATSLLIFASDSLYSSNTLVYHLNDPVLRSIESDYICTF